MLVAIAALDPDRVIGKDGLLPWHLPGDLKLFKALTSGHAVIMGRKTWDSLPRRPLPGRRNIVVSGKPPAEAGGAEWVRSIDAVAAWAESPDTAFLIGGASLYTSMLARCSELILTHVLERHPGDTWFPEYEAQFEPVEEIASGEGFRTVRYRRRGNSFST